MQTAMSSLNALVLYATPARRLVPLVAPVVRAQAAEPADSPWSRPMTGHKGRLVDLRV